MIKICPFCKTSNELSIDFEVVNLICKKCHKISDQNGKIFETLSVPAISPILKINQSTIIDGTTYWITGILVKNTSKIYYWREYFLRNKAGGTLFLSESNGHWVIYKEKELNIKFHKKSYPNPIEIENKTYYIFNKNLSIIKYAEGFFDYEVLVGNHLVYDYIDPPYTISIERYSDIQYEFEGEHIAAESVKKMFSLSNMPYKSGTGMVSPMIFTNLKKHIFILFFFIGLIVLIEIFNQSKQISRKVLEEILNLSIYNEKNIFKSNSFVLDGSLAAPLTCYMSSDVDNNWAELGISIINERTNAELYSSSGVEAYSGYSDGEHWSEGSTENEIQICGVPPGKYHIELTPYSDRPQLDTALIKLDTSYSMINYSTYPQSIYIKVVWNSNSIWNSGVSILILLLLALGLYFYRDYTEKNRWSESDFERN